jgi:hypothetical protein
MTASTPGRFLYSIKTILLSHYHFYSNRDDGNRVRAFISRVMLMGNSFRLFESQLLQGIFLLLCFRKTLELASQAILRFVQAFVQYFATGRVGYKPFFVEIYLWWYPVVDAI